jgi:hypothetical protein
MAYTIGKRMVTYQPVARPEPGGAPFLTGGIPKVGSILTMQSGVWNGHPPFNPRFQWFTMGTAIANATNSTFAIPVSASSMLSCRMSMGNNKWGTNWRDGATGPIIP